MMTEGSVSLWMGQAASREALEAYLEIKYTEDGDEIRPRFSVDFAIDRFDEDFREAVYFSVPRSTLSDVLRGVSYEEVIAPRFAARYGDDLSEGVTAAILLFDFAYHGHTRHFTAGTLQFKYVGSVPYR